MRASGFYGDCTGDNSKECTALNNDDIRFVNELTNNVTTGNLIIQHAVRRFGELHQIDRAIEEMAELTVALQKFRRALDEGKRFNRSDKDPIVDHVKEEIADVKVVMKSLNNIFGPTMDIELYKLKRLDKRMKDPPLFDELK